MKTKLNKKQDNLLESINDATDHSTNNAKYIMRMFPLHDMHEIKWKYNVYTHYAYAARNFAKLLKTFGHAN
jgi:hypothetical protein